MRQATLFSAGLLQKIPRWFHRSHSYLLQSVFHRAARGVLLKRGQIVALLCSKFSHSFSAYFWVFQTPCDALTTGTVGHWVTCWLLLLPSSLLHCALDMLTCFSSGCQAHWASLLLLILLLGIMSRCLPYLLFHFLQISARLSPLQRYLTTCIRNCSSPPQHPLSFLFAVVITPWLYICIAILFLFCVSVYFLFPLLACKLYVRERLWLLFPVVSPLPRTASKS